MEFMKYFRREFSVIRNMSLAGIIKHLPAATAIACALLVHGTVSGQSALPDFDGSIRSMRANATGVIRIHADEYLRFAPGVFMLGLKAGGCESRSSWGRMIVSDAFSAGIMTIAVNGLKYSIDRPRPDGASGGSFPSGHTATAFMAAAMLHEEYGWRSPWFSFGGYAIASATGISRIINDRHWASDVIAGAVIGVASVRLGYFLADLIFKDRYLNAGYLPPVPGFVCGKKYYDIGLYFGYRFLAGTPDDGTLCRGGAVTGLGISVPIACSDRLKGTVGIAADIGINSYTDGRSLSFNTYDFLAGGYWRHAFARVLETDAQLLAGYSLPGNTSISRPAGLADGFTLSCGGSFGVATGENFKIKLFARYEISDISVRRGMVQGAVVGGSASIFW